MQRAQCAHDVARQQACMAKQERGVTNTALGGCGLGVIAGVLSGGALAGWALAGCGAGYLAGEADRNACPAPACIRESEQWLAIEAEKHEHVGFPVCRAGIDINELTVYVPQAVYIEAVVSGSAAEEAGLRRGDILLRVNGRDISSSEDLGVAVRSAPVRAPSSMLYLRGDRLRMGRGTIARRGPSGRERRLLGVQYRPKTDIRYPAVTIAAASGQSGFRDGDQVLAINGVIPTSARAAMEAFAEADATIEVTVSRGDVVVDIEVDLRL